MLRVLFKFLMKQGNSSQYNLQLLEVMVVRYASPHMLPDIFLGIQLRGVGWQPFDSDLMPVFLQQLANRFGLVRLVVVHKQDHLAFWMIGQLVGPRDGGQQMSEANVVAPVMNHMHCLTSDWINSSPVPTLRCSHAGRQDHSLLANFRPAAGDGSKQTHLGRVCEKDDQLSAGLGLQFNDSFFSPQRGQSLAYV